jgi:N-acetylglucosaminyldiphosphoundecaprenol N-acetyl-beta-D-mannosaminyltransferase
MLMNKISILNIDIHNITLDQLLRDLEKGVVITPNIDHLVKLQKDKEFYDVYRSADFITCDSKLVQLASRFLDTPIVEKISGSDFFPAFCDFHKNNDHIKIFLLGADQGVAEKAAANINKKTGREIVIDYRSPSFGFEKKEDECMEIVQQINDSGATALAVGVGAPKQEKWIMKYKDKMPNVDIFMAIGATIDFEAGNVKRAPKWMSDYGMEWMYRLLSEPKRLWKRYLVDDMPFFWYILKQKLGIYKNPWE